VVQLLSGLGGGPGRIRRREEPLIRRPITALCLAALLCLAAGPAVAAEKTGKTDGAPPSEPAEKPPEAGKTGGKEKETPADGNGGKKTGEKKTGKKPADPRLEKALTELDRTSRGTRTLAAPYVQKRKVRISRRIRKAEGIFYLEKPPKTGMRILFVETKPHRMKLLFTDDRVVFLDQESGKKDVRDPRKGGVRPSEVWVLGRSRKDLEKSYTFSLGTLDEKEKETYAECLVLTPRSKKVGKWVKELRIWLRKKTWMPLRVRMVDPSGEYQEFLFDEKKLLRNRKIDPKVFDVGD
jgi:outer membrane lipoprotein-sorting protein